MGEKLLMPDKLALATCLLPEELAKENQAFHIYNPATMKYINVTTSSPFREQGSKHVETDSDIRGHGKQFKFRSRGDGTYNIVTLNEEGDENGFLYVSEKIQQGVFHRQSTVLKSDDIVQGQEKQYTFNISVCETHWGLYMILCNGKTLFPSKDYLLADEKHLQNPESAWFHFNLKTRIVNAETTGEERIVNVSEVDSSTESFKYKNVGSEAVDVRFNLKDKIFVRPSEDNQSEDVTTEDAGFIPCKPVFIPCKPVRVEKDAELTMENTSKLTSAIKMIKTTFETESGKKFIGHTEHYWFHCQRGWKF